MDELINNVSEQAYKNIQKWLTEPKYSEYKSELEQMIKNRDWKELEDSFFKVLEFGTAGRRGTTGVGSNRMNRVTVGESAQALCTYVSKFDENAHQKGIVIAFDTRLSSPELSHYAAQVCAGNGFKTYIFDSFRATPELSFAVRHLGCSAGIVISASHNPPADNGFKAYWSDGAQVASPHDSGILEAAENVTEIVAAESFEEAVSNGKLSIIGKDVDEAYLSATTSQSEGEDRDIKIVYSPLHGTGQVSVLPTLERAGFKDITLVKEQMVPDGNFPTVPDLKPNPEEKKANGLAVEKMLEIGADIAITNDPDADRLGVMVNQQGEAIYLNGNQTAAIATHYALKKKQEKGQLTKDHYIVKTIVTTDLLNAIADKFNVGIYDNLLIGFKYIGKVILENEGTEKKFVTGSEESFGLLKGDYARDKDGATGALMIAECAAELKKQGKTLFDHLMDLYQELGLFVEKMETAVYPGAEGFVTMQNIMSSFRANPPKMIGDNPVTSVLDYDSLKKTDADGTVSDIDCVKGNVLVFECGSHSRRVTIRPSGTEPKLKFYFQWQNSTQDAETDYRKLEEYLGELYKDLAEEALRRV